MPTNKQTEFTYTKQQISGQQIVPRYMKRDDLMIGLGMIKPTVTKETVKKFKDFNNLYQSNYGLNPTLA
jgi:hypothetical protein